MKHLFFAFLFLLSVFASGQKIQLVEGDARALKDLKSIAVQVTYDSLLVGAEFPETDFVETRKKLWDEKEPGKGDAWVKHWYESKDNLYESTFAYMFGKNSGLAISKDSPYRLILKTNQIEPGWSGGPMGGPAFIIADLWIVESANPENVVAKFKVQRIKGIDQHGGDFEMGRRIQQAYVNAGKSLGAYFKNKVI